MGRKTWDSLPVKPLPNRRNIVLSSKNIAEVETYNSVDACLKILTEDGVNDIFVIGGTGVYEQFFSKAAVLHITMVNELVAGIDTYFPFNMTTIKKQFKLTIVEKKGNSAKYTKWEKF